MISATQVALHVLSEISTHVGIFGSSGTDVNGVG